MLIWFNYQKEWLEVMSIIFDSKGEISKISACKPGAHPISDGWWNLEGKDLKHVGIDANIVFNKELIPKK